MKNGGAVIRIDPSVLKKYRIITPQQAVEEMKALKLPDKDAPLEWVPLPTETLVIYCYGGGGGSANNER